MKFLLPLLSFFLGNAKGFFRDPTVAITQQLIQHIRSLVVLIVSTVGSLALSCVGFSLLIVNLADQLDSNNGFLFTFGFGLYLGMTVVFAGVLVWSLRRKTWLKAVRYEERPQQEKKKGSPIENAVALLLMDYLEERRQRRENSNSN